MILDITKQLQQKTTAGPKSIHFIESNAQKASAAPFAPLKLPPSGLENLGNTCFMNSALQLLSASRDFRTALESGKHTCPIQKFCIVCCTLRHLKKGTEGTVFAPREFASNLKQIGRQFKLGRQEDSHEFLRCLIDKLNDVLKSMEGVFGGTLASEVICSHCNYVSSKIDPIMDLSLDIKNCSSIEQALLKFTAPELLRKGNQYNCEKCNTLRDAQKRIVIGKPPKVLAIQLKRFNSLYMNAKKVTRAVKFQETLQVSPSARYSLFGVLVHSGHSCNSGHYYSYVKPSKSSAWYRMNDEEVTRVGAEHVLSQSAYILIYEKLQDSSVKESVTVAKELPLNSTLDWTVDNIIPKKESLNIILNSTMFFQVELFTKAPTSTGEIHSHSATSQNKDLKYFSPQKSSQPSAQLSHGNFFEELQRNAPMIQTWSHVATSDKVFERRVFLEQQQREERLKRKRASRDDMEYETPKRYKNNKRFV